MQYNDNENKILYIFIGILIGELIGTAIALVRFYQLGMLK